MMVVDASVILAIVFQEDDFETFEAALAVPCDRAISAINYWECLVGAHGKFGTRGAVLVEEILARMNVHVVRADAELGRSAANAFARYKGRAGGRLNLGDCFAYALAMQEGDGLLYKGNDFPKTDIKSVL